MRGFRLVSLLLELVLLASSLVTGGPVAAGIRAVAVVVAAMVGALVVFVAVVLTLGLVEQRRPPYPM